MAWFGWWVSCFPSGISGGRNLYAYAQNNPIINIDPAGTCDESVEKSEEARKLYHLSHKIHLLELFTEYVQAVNTLDKYKKSHINKIAALKAASLGWLPEDTMSSFISRLDMYLKAASEEHEAEKAVKFLRDSSKSMKSGSSLNEIRFIPGNTINRANTALDKSKIGRGIKRVLGKGGRFLTNPAVQKVNTGLMVFSGAVIGGVELPSSTFGGRVANATLSGYSGYFTLKTGLWVFDLVLPEGASASEAQRGIIGAWSIIARGDVKAAEQYHEMAKGGRLGWYAHTGSWMYEYIDEKGGLGTLFKELRSWRKPGKPWKPGDVQLAPVGESMQRIDESIKGPGSY